MTGSQQHARQATSLVIGQVLAGLSQAVIPILLVRLLPALEVGILSAVLLIYQLFAPILAAAFPATLMYYLPTRDPAARRAVASRVARVMLGLGAMLGGVLASLGLIALLAPDTLRGFTDQVVGGTSALGPEGLKYLLILAPLPLGDLPSRMLPNLLVVEGRAGTAAVIGVLKAIATAIFTLLPIVLGLNLWVVSGSLAALGLLHGALVWYYLWRLFPGTRRQQADVRIRELFGFAVPLGLTDAVMTLNNRLDQFLIALAFVASMVATYRVGAFQIPMITTVAYSVGSVITPKLTQLLGQGRAHDALGLWRAAIGKVSLIVVPVTLVFVVAAEETMELLFTREYHQAADVFRCYAILTLGRVAAYGSVIVAAGKPRYLFQAALLSFASNLALSIPLLFLVGFVGPALGTMLAFIPTTIFYCWGIARATGLRFTETFPLLAYGKVLLLGGVSAAAAWAVKLQLSTHAGVKLALVAILIIGLFGALGSVTGLIQRGDWQFFGQWLRGKKPSVQ